MLNSRKNITLKVAASALLVRAIYALNGIVLTYYVYQVIGEPLIFLLNALLIASVMEVVVTLKYKKRGEWTWFIPSVLIYLLWVVPSILTLEIVALNYRNVVVHDYADLMTCPIVFKDECAEMAEITEGSTQSYSSYGTNITVGNITPRIHDLSRHYSMLFQQIMMLVIIFGRWLAPKGKLSRDQLSSLLLGLMAMIVDMLEFSTDSLSIQVVACDNVYVAFILIIWCWSLLQIPMGLTAVKQRKPRVIGQVESRCSDVRTVGNNSKSDDDILGKFGCASYICCCCESEIWAIIVSMCMQDGPYLIIRLYIIFSAGYFGETLIFFAAKNTIIVMLQSYRLYVKIRERFCPNIDQTSEATRHSDVEQEIGESDADRQNIEAQLVIEKISEKPESGKGKVLSADDSCNDPLSNDSAEGGEQNMGFEADCGSFDNTSIGKVPLDAMDNAAPDGAAETVGDQSGDKENGVIP